MKSAIFSSHKRSIMFGRRRFGSLLTIHKNQLLSINFGEIYFLLLTPYERTQSSLSDDAAEAVANR